MTKRIKKALIEPAVTQRADSECRQHTLKDLKDTKDTPWVNRQSHPNKKAMHTTNVHFQITKVPNLQNAKAGIPHQRWNSPFCELDIGKQTHAFCARQLHKNKTKNSKL